MTAAMWVEFNEALGAFFGPSLGVVVGMLVFLIYQDRKNVRQFSGNKNYSKMKELH